MSGALEAFDDQAVTGRSRLDQVATLLTSPAMCPDESEMLVIALRPERDTRRVISSAGYSAVRASVSVSIAAGNHRAWARVSPGEIVDVPMGALPEIIRSSIQPSGMQSVRVAVVDGDNGRDCLVMWLTRAAKFSAEAHARHVTALQNLTDAAARDRVAAAEKAAQQALESERVAAATAAAERSVPDGDPLGALRDRGEFDETLADLRSDETGLIVFGIDKVDEVIADFGEAAADVVRRAVAARLSRACRRNDVIARIADDVFAVLLVDVDRRTAFEVSKRLRSEMSEPVVVEGGTVDVSLSVGLSHDVGLIDPVELFESAEAAMEEAHQAGGARMLVAT